MMSGLLEAAHEGDLARVQRLIREGADVTETDEYGRTVLLVAASANVGKSHATMLQWLLEEGVSSITENHTTNALGSPWNMWRLFTTHGAIPISLNYLRCSGLW
jgi:ankyrin repeat protein